jgi:ferritin-like metal-binding protein YciE
MSEMTKPRQLFLHELGDALYAEHVLVKALPELAREAGDRELREGFELHLTETKQHVKNIEQAFSMLGVNAKAEKCPGIEGIKVEHDEFMSKEQPSPAIRDMFLTGAGARTEHYEIAAYTGLVTAAKALGESECAALLGANLREEKAALRKLETISKRLAKGAKSSAKAQKSARRIAVK